jgi:ferredoxin
MTEIYYFSGTGNTYWSAKKLASLLGDAAVLPIRREIKRPRISVEAEAAVFMFPVYAYGMPGMARRFLEKAEIHAGYIAALASYGTSPGGALAEVRRVLRRKKLRLNYAGRIPAVENYVPIFGQPRAKALKTRLALQAAATEDAARAIRSRAHNRVFAIHPLSRFVHSLFRFASPHMSHLFRISAACNACGACSRLCPAEAITMTAEGPVFQSGCEQCQGCLNYCPRRALNFGRMHPDTAGYHHPEVTAGDLFGAIDH